jgi:hypothetical protein
MIDAVFKKLIWENNVIGNRNDEVGNLGRSV